jgi:hypothetical protein
MLGSIKDYRCMIEGRMHAYLCGPLPYINFTNFTEKTKLKGASEVPEACTGPGNTCVRQRAAATHLELNLLFMVQKLRKLGVLHVFGNLPRGDVVFVDRLQLCAKLYKQQSNTDSIESCSFCVLWRRVWVCKDFARKKMKNRAIVM